MPERKQRLRHSSDSEPGYSRKRKGRHWAYFDENGKRVTDRATIDRLNSIGLPPAYSKAWFCKHPNGHLQAIGVDARGRKQYRYHQDYRTRADKKKFGSLLEFGQSLKRLRTKVDEDLRRRSLGREKVLAAVTHLLDTQYLRVGNEKYATQNNSFGATTLLCRHVKGKEGKVRMRFATKGGKTRDVVITDRRLGRIVRQCRELPGQPLFQYITGEPGPHPITSTDVNEYIREAADGDFTAKHFRTWWASVIAFGKLLDAEEGQHTSVQTMVEPAAEALGNTVAISRKSYVHPALIKTVKDNPGDPLGGVTRPRDWKWLSSAEVGFLKFLESKKPGKTAKAA
ncbi:MAG TPA: DNA topoisomerase IB [Sphingomicrobium sp.]|nr:DNA topoisomerase IB [Sphingomicrobium sp.]